MTTMDIGILIFVGVGIVVGLWRGLVFELFTILALPLSFAFTYLFHDKLMQMIFGEDMSMEWHLGLYAVAFIVSFIAFYIVSVVLQTSLKLTGMWLLDKALGAFLGGLKHTLFLLILLLALLAYPVPSVTLQLKESTVVPWIIKGTWYLHQTFPEPYKSSCLEYLNKLHSLERIEESEPETQDNK